MVTTKKRGVAHGSGAPAVPHRRVRAGVLSWRCPRTQKRKRFTRGYDHCGGSGTYFENVPHASGAASKSNDNNPNCG